MVTPCMEQLLMLGEDMKSDYRDMKVTFHFGKWGPDLLDVAEAVMLCHV